MLMLIHNTEYKVSDCYFGSGCGACLYLTFVADFFRSTNEK